jgi:hypothetical protein
MDDFVVPSLKDARFEWAARLTNILTPHIIDGISSIFEDSCKLCRETNENEKYLMTFQNFLSRIPKWNENMIDIETKRIVERCQCKYLEDLVTCVHIIQLKLLSAIRVCSKQKKIDINVPKLSAFIHKVYISVARKFYKNAYLFEISISRLQKQKNMSEIEKIVEECILNAIRESIPIEELLKAYMADSFEDEYKEEVKEIKEEVISQPQTSLEEIQPPPQELSEQKTSNQPVLEIPSLDPYVETSLNDLSSLSSSSTPSYSSTATAAPKVTFDSNIPDDHGIKILDDAPSIVLDMEPLDSSSISLNSDVVLDDIEVLY